MAMLDAYEQWRHEINYVASRFRQLVASRGGVGAARHLLRQTGTSSGFERLAAAGKLDLTVEFLVLRREFGGLFTPEERGTARRRLVERGMARDRLPTEPVLRAAMASSVLRRIALIAVVATLVVTCVPAASPPAPSPMPASGPTAVATDAPSPTAVTTRGVADLAGLRWSATDLVPAEGNAVLAISPWHEGFVAAGGGFNFGRIQAPADPSAPIELMNAVFWHTDDGRHWTTSPDQPTYHGAFIHHIVAFEDRLLAFGTTGFCLPDACSGLPPNGGTRVWESTDGSTWAVIPDGGLQDGAVRTVVPSADGGLIAGGYVADTQGKPANGFSPPTDAAVWTSPDGRSWTSMAVSRVPDSIDQMAVAGRDVVAITSLADGSTIGVWRSSDSGGSWTEGPSDGGATIDAVAPSGEGLLMFSELEGAAEPALDTQVHHVPIFPGDTLVYETPIPAFRASAASWVGTAVLLAGNHTSVRGGLIQNDHPRLMSSPDGTTWSAMDVPKGWADGSPALLAVGSTGIVALVRAEFPGGPADPSAPVWIGEFPTS